MSNGMMRNTDILIVDDEIGIREILKETLEDEGYTVVLAENVETARRLRNQVRPAMVLLDIWMPDSDGITLLKEWAQSGQLDMPVVMMSGHGSIDTAVEATKIGAIDFLEKPIALNKLLTAVERALKHREEYIITSLPLDKLGQAAAINELREQVLRAFNQNSAISLQGETGSPFEMVARFFHRDGMPWVEPTKMEHIIEMPIELLQKASGGILYLGELGQYDSQIQRGIGFLLNKAERHNVRIIYTCNRPLHELLEQSEQDDYLSNLTATVTINIPALREQKEDIEFLVNQMIEEQHHTDKPITLNRHALVKLKEYNWPGNFAQLCYVVKNLLLTVKNNEITEEDVNQVLHRFEIQNTAVSCSGFDFNLPLRELREELERRYFEYHIAQEGHNMSRVAQKVGLERTHLYRKLKQLGIYTNKRSGKE